MVLKTLIGSLRKKRSLPSVYDIQKDTLCFYVQYGYIVRFCLLGTIHEVRLVKDVKGSGGKTSIFYCFLVWRKIISTI